MRRDDVCRGETVLDVVAFELVAAELFKPDPLGAARLRERLR